MYELTSVANSHRDVSFFHLSIFWLFRTRHAYWCRVRQFAATSKEGCGGLGRAAGSDAKICNGFASADAQTLHAKRQLRADLDAIQR